MVSKDLSPHLKTKIIDGSLKDVERESEKFSLNNRVNRSKDAIRFTC